MGSSVKINIPFVHPLRLGIQVGRYLSLVQYELNESTQAVRCGCIAFCQAAEGTSGLRSGACLRRDDGARRGRSVSELRRVAVARRGAAEPPDAGLYSVMIQGPAPTPTHVSKRLKPLQVNILNSVVTNIAGGLS